MNFNQTIVDQIFNDTPEPQAMLSLRRDCSKETWYNVCMLPNIGTSLFLEVCADSDQCFSDSDAELIEFLQGTVHSNKESSNKKHSEVLKVLGKSEKCIKLKSKVTAGKPTAAEMVFDTRQTLKRFRKANEKSLSKQRKREIKLV